MRDNKSVLLLFLSIGLVGTWVYHLYDKNKYGSGQKTKTIQIDTQAVIRPYLDSIRLLAQNTTPSSYPKPAPLDSINEVLDARMAEVNSLKKQIGSILRKQNISSTDLQSARDLIRDLRFRIEDMQVQNSDLERERSRLNGVMSQLNAQLDSLQTGMQSLDAENKKLSRQITDASVFVATNLSLKAMLIRSGNKEVVTQSAKKAKKLVVSFDVQNNAMNFSNAELAIVIKDPKGNTVMEDIWGSGSFDTRKEGKITFTRKVKFDYTQGEPYPVLFSISPEEFSSGTYQLLIYHNGLRIGRTTLGLQ